MLADYHVHSMFSNDSWYLPEHVAEDAWTSNLDEICFTDHVDYGVRFDWQDALRAKVVFGSRLLNVDYDAYFPTVAGLKAQWAGRIAIKTGLEFGVQTHTISRFNKLWERWGDKLDFVLLSVHQVGDVEFWTGEFQEGLTQAEYNHAYYQELYDVATGFDYYSCLAHLDLIKRYDSTGALPFPANKELVAATLEHVIAHGKGIELNTSSVRFGLADSQPAEEILRLYRDLGGSVITIGSDSHAPGQLGAYIRHFQHYLASLGFEGFCTFDNMEPTMHRWDFA